MVSRSTTTMRKLSSQRGGLLEAAGHRSYFTIVSNVIVKIRGIVHGLSPAELKLNGEVVEVSAHNGDSG